jgi:hypothetical protein
VPGSGGSAGAGFSPGKDAVDETLSTNSDYEQNRAGKASLSGRDNSVDTPIMPDEGFCLDKFC